jgi:phosphoenolpyruvate-protein kinase (PTS system EI component)
MTERPLAGTPASPGVALGTAWRSAEEPAKGSTVPPERRGQEREAALAALAAAARALTAVAERLDPEQAEIVATGVLIGQDPALIAAVQEAVLADGRGAAEAIVRATDEYAAAIAAIGDPMLAARADDVRSLGRRAARLATGRDVAAPPGSDLILIAHDLGPADVAELAPVLAGIALLGGGPTAHAAIVARSLGIPMVTGLGPRLLETTEGAPLVIDGSIGKLIREPSAERVELATMEMGARRIAAVRAHELRDQPAVTTDGTRIMVLANVSSPEELQLGRGAGAEGIGLLRTELAFLDAGTWPTEQQHTEALAPILAGLRGRPAVVRVLDFGADKSPPFLRGTAERGLALLLANPDALTAQLRAILHCAQRHDVRILLPMVDTPEQVDEVTTLIERVAAQRGIERTPPLGAMIETPAAAEQAAAIAARAAFLSIGTNDLTAATLGADRFNANDARAYDPRVLRSIARSVEAAHVAGIPIEVCGEAASDPIMVPLLVGLGVDELSVGAARVGHVRGWIRGLSRTEAAGLARSALTMDSAEEVEWAARPLAAQIQSDGGTHARKLSAA